jgi:hypothetical protein
MANNNAPVPQNLSSFMRGNAPPQESLASFLNAQNFEAAIFFDNDQHKIDQVQQACGNIIRCVKVGETSHDGTLHFYTEKHMKELKNKLQDKKYFNFLLSLIPRWYAENPTRPPEENPHVSDAYDIESGVQTPHIEELNSWIQETSTLSKRAAIFDWDRTLTMFEGFPIKTNATTTFEQRLRYLLGGDERYDQIRNMLRDLHTQGIEIFILTNNGACGNPHYGNLFPNLVTDLFSRIIPGIPFIPATILCSRQAPYHGHKGRAIKSVTGFGACVRQQAPSAGNQTQGGKRRRKTKRGKKIRKTRKQNGRVRYN